MKKFKFLPSVLMLVACIAVLCVGVFSLTPTESTIGGTINISSMARVKLTCYLNEEIVYDRTNTAYGVDWDLSDALDFDLSNYTEADQVPLRTIRIHIQNLTNLHLGVCFYNGQESTLQTIGEEKYVTYDSLQLTDAVYKANAEETDENKLVDITLSTYGYIAPANDNNSYDEYDMFINFDVVNLDIAETSKIVGYKLRIEEYQSNVTIDGSNNASFTPLEGKTKQLVKLPTTNTNTAVPKLADATYGNVVIPTTYTSILANGLTGCTGVSAISIPQSLTNIANTAMNGCSALKSIDIHSTPSSDFLSTATTLNIASSVSAVVGDFSSGNLLKNVHISNGVLCIVGSTFDSCGGLTKITIPSGLSDGLGVGTFYNCVALKSVVLPDDLTFLEEAVFWGCTNLTNITIPSSLTEIHPAAFRECNSLTEVDLSNCTNLTYIGEEAFGDCTNLRNLYIPDSLECFEGGTVCSDFEFNIYENCNYLGNESNPYVCLMSAIDTSKTTYTIHEDTKCTVYGAFSGNTNIQSITIPENFVCLGNKTFYGCTALKSVTFPQQSQTIMDPMNENSATIYTGGSLKTIGDYAFAGCTALTSIDIASTVETIGSYAFSGCTSLATVNMRASQNEWWADEEGDWEEGPDGNLVPIDGYTLFVNSALSTISSYAFTNCSKLTSIIIPKSVTLLDTGALNGCGSCTYIRVFATTGTFRAVLPVITILNENGLSFSWWDTPDAPINAGKTIQPGVEYTAYFE